MANTTVSNLWGASQPITITLASLATSANAGRESSLITSNGYADGALHLKFMINSGGSPTSDGIYIYAAKGVDLIGDNLTDPCTGTDAAITFQATGSPTNLTMIGRVNVNATVTHYDFHCSSLAQCFGGNLPISWSIIVNNAGGSTWTATEAQFTKEWFPLTVQAG